MKYRLVVSDVDGCISPEESVGWDLDAVRLLATRVAGTAFTICTGRPQPYVEALMKILDVGLPAICENGAVFYDLEHNAPWLGPGVTPEGVVALRAVRAHIEHEMLARYAGAALQYGKEAQIIVFSADPSLIEPLAAEVNAFVATARGGADGGAIGATEFTVDFSHYYLNVSLKGVTKGSALAVLLDRLGVSPGECAVIGDTSGDLPMRPLAGFFGCPANATPAVKSAADYVSPYRDIRGVLDILDQISAD